MKKHTQRISEKAFAANLDLGERFAASEASDLREINKNLMDRGLYARQLRWSEIEPRQRNHFCCFEVTNDVPSKERMIRKKHRPPMSERAFAAALVQGERFGISEGTDTRALQRALNERGLRAKQVPLSELGQNAFTGEYFAIFDLVADDP